MSVTYSGRIFIEFIAWYLDSDLVEICGDLDFKKIDYEELYFAVGFSKLNKNITVSFGNECFTVWYEDIENDVVDVLWDFDCSLDLYDEGNFSIAELIVAQIFTPFESWILKHHQNQSRLLIQEGPGFQSVRLVIGPSGIPLWNENR